MSDDLHERVLEMAKDYDARSHWFYEHVGQHEPMMDDTYRAMASTYATAAYDLRKLVQP